MATINTLDDFLQALDDNPAWRDAVRARILGDELLRLPVRFEVFVQEQRAFNEEQRVFNDEMRTFREEQKRVNANFEARFRRIETDISGFRGDYARTKTTLDAQGIASDMGLEFIRTLGISDLMHMAGNSLPRDVNRSFRNADLVIEATDGTDTQYIAMEVSYTANLRDCERAMRNADLITQLTGRPARAAVASVLNDREAASR